MDKTGLKSNKKGVKLHFGPKVDQKWTKLYDKIDI